MVLRKAHAENGNSTLVDPWNKKETRKENMSALSGSNSNQSNIRYIPSYMQYKSHITELTIITSRIATGKRKQVAEVIVIAWSRLLSWFWNQKMNLTRCYLFFSNKNLSVNIMSCVWIQNIWIGIIEVVNTLKRDSPCNHPSKCW